MKLKDYLEKYKNMNLEAEVYFRTPDGCCAADTHDLGEPEVDFFATYVLVEFPAMPFFKTCRRSGAMKDLLRKIEDGKP